VVSEHNHLLPAGREQPGHPFAQRANLSIKQRRQLGLLLVAEFINVAVLCPATPRWIARVTVEENLVTLFRQERAQSGDSEVGAADFGRGSQTVSRAQSRDDWRHGRLRGRSDGRQRSESGPDLSLETISRERGLDALCHIESEPVDEDQASADWPIDERFDRIVLGGLPNCLLEAADAIVQPGT